uniref:Uncharacterized protein n=1 Tax=Rhodnius prolixus TaxID=13249 RepID=T1HX86_RHOPR
MSEKVLRTLWLDILPDSIKNVLLITEEDLGKVAMMANKMVENVTGNVYAMNKNNHNNVMNEILSKMSTLEMKIAALQTDGSRGRSLSTSSHERHRTSSNLCSTMEQSKSQWVSPLHLAPKKDRTLRPCAATSVGLMTKQYLVGTLHHELKTFKWKKKIKPKLLLQPHSDYLNLTTVLDCFTNTLSPAMQWENRTPSHNIENSTEGHNSSKWTESLPTMLLELRAAVNPETKVSVAQMVYGTHIRIPGEFIGEPTKEELSHKILDQAKFVSDLQRRMELLRPVPVRNKSAHSPFVYKELKDCSHVFLRTDRVRKPLEPAYEVPYAVVARSDKYFTINRKNAEVKSSIVRLKPANGISTEPVTTESSLPHVPVGPTAARNERKASDSLPPVIGRDSATTTRNGRRVHFPRRFLTAQPTDRQAKTLDAHALLVAALIVAKSRSRQARSIRRSGCFFYKRLGGVIGNQLIGTYFYRENLTGERSSNTTKICNKKYNVPFDKQKLDAVSRDTGV